MTLTGLPHSEISGCGCQHLPGAYRSVATSFIGSRRQGIHPAPLSVCALCWVQRLRSAVLRLGPERERALTEREAHKAVVVLLPARSRLNHVGFVILCRLSYVVGKVQRHLAAP